MTEQTEQNITMNIENKETAETETQPQPAANQDTNLNLQLLINVKNLLELAIRII